MSAIRLTQRKSRNGCDRRQLATLRSLGLRRINHTVEVNDTPQIRGMIAKVRHLVEIEESAGADSRAGSPGGEPAGAKS